MTIRAALCLALGLLAATTTACAAPVHRAAGAAAGSVVPMPAATAGEVPALPTPSSPAPELLLGVPADVPQAALEARLDGDVALLVRVTPAGWVDSVCVVSGDVRLRESAVAAARWHVYRPAPEAGPRWTRLAIAIRGALDVDPLVPDLFALAAEAEASGDWRGALDAWTGALTRVGTHPTLQNEWALREHILRAAAHLTPYPTPGAATGTARSARIQQERVLARAIHADLVGKFDRALRVAPWWGDAYLWRAASEAGCGRVAEAVRSLRCYQLARPDSVGLWLSGRALAALAASDTLGASELIKRHAEHFNVDVPR